MQSTLGSFQETQSQDPFALQNSKLLKVSLDQITIQARLGSMVAYQGDVQFEHAGSLWGAIEQEDAVAPLGGWRRHRHECEALIREAAGPKFETACAEGRTLTLDDAVSLALDRRDIET